MPQRRELLHNSTFLLSRIVQHECERNVDR
jgi:hypothetical protein